MPNIPNDATTQDAADTMEAFLDELTRPATPATPEALISPDGELDLRAAWLAVYRRQRRELAGLVREGRMSSELAKVVAQRLTPYHFENLLDIARLRKALASIRKAGKRQQVQAYSEHELEAFEQSLTDWTARLQWAGVTSKIADLDDLDYEDHPLRTAIWQGMDPEDFSRRNLQGAHSRWMRMQAKKQAAVEQRRDAGLASAGSTRELQELKKQKQAEETESAVKVSKADQLYIEAATAVLESWKAKGAPLPGVRWPLQRTSKPVRWLKALTEGRERKTVKQTAKRMAAKQKGWEADLEAYRSWKG